MKIQFSTEGIAFKGMGDKTMDDIHKRQEVARILKRIATFVESGNDNGDVIDSGGNTIGSWEL